LPPRLKLLARSTRRRPHPCTARSSCDPAPECDSSPRGSSAHQKRLRRPWSAQLHAALGATKPFPAHPSPPLARTSSFAAGSCAATCSILSVLSACLRSPTRSSSDRFGLTRQLGW